eukprot:355264-Chlamydomonas_euryale.AAC.2
MVLRRWCCGHGAAAMVLRPWCCGHGAAAKETHRWMQKSRCRSCLCNTGAGAGRTAACFRQQPPPFRHAATGAAP